jgi:hypothetical protein
LKRRKKACVLAVLVRVADRSVGRTSCANGIALAIRLRVADRSVGPTSCANGIALRIGVHFDAGILFFPQAAFFSKFLTKLAD